MSGLISQLRTLLGHNRVHRVGVSDASVVDNEGRVWVEVGGCGGGATENGRGLKLRVTHLHPDNPALASAILQYRSTQTGVTVEDLQKTEPELDKVSLCSQEDFWFNHWQGPAISPEDPTAPLPQEPQQRRGSSVRRSTRRCTTCHKKVANASSPEPPSPPDDPPESPVLAHLPSLRRSQIRLGPPPPATINPPDPAHTSAHLAPPIASDQDKAKGEDYLLSRTMSSSDEQLSRAQRVLEHEQRTSVDMFADTVDGATPFSAATNSPNTNALGITSASPDHLSLPATVASALPWRSRSCPCSPKLSTRSSRAYSPELSPSHSPKSGSCSSSKFSLGGSLLAIHRQASNSLRGDFFKSDGGSARGDKYHDHTAAGGGGGGSSNTRSLQNSIKLKKRSPSSINEEEGDSSVISDGETSGEVSVQSTIVKRPIQESHSLPVLKLSRMALTYRGGLLTKDDRDFHQLLVREEESSSPEVTEESDAGACGQTQPYDESTSEFSTPPGHSSLLPDLIPVSRESPSRGFAPGQLQSMDHPHGRPHQQMIPVAAVSPFHFNTKEGVVNLGFDGHSESSDFTEENTGSDVVPVTNNMPGSGDGPPQIHGMSVGFLRSPECDVSGFDVPPTNINVYTDHNDDSSPLQSPTSALSRSSFPEISSGFSSNHDLSNPSTSSTLQSNFSTAPSTAPCSPSALRIRVMDGKPNNRGESARLSSTVQGPQLLQSNLHHPQHLLTAGTIEANQHQRQQFHQQQQSSGGYQYTKAGNHLRPSVQRNDSISPGGVEHRELNTDAANTILNIGQAQASASRAYNRAVHSGELLDRRSRPLPAHLQQLQQQQQQQNQQLEQQQMVEEEFDEEATANLEAARALVYWWRKPAAEDGDDYCLKQGECGLKQRPLLLFVHSVGGSADDWHHQLWYFVANGYEVVAPDLLGHGYSSAPDSAACYRFPRLLQHLRLLFDLFVPAGRKCVLMGHGYGCALVSALSRCRPSSVPLLVLAACGGPSPLLPPPPHVTQPKSSTKKGAAGSEDASGDTWSELHQAVTELKAQCLGPPAPPEGSTLHPYFAVSGGCCGAAQEELAECCELVCGGAAAAREGAGVWGAFKTVLSTTCWLICCLPCVCAKREVVYQVRGKQLCSGALSHPGASSTPAHVLRHVMRGQRWPEGDVAFHRRLTVPVLLLHGLKDSTVPLVHMCEMEKTIPRAFLEVLGSCGHHLMTDSPPDVNASLHRFLRRWGRLTT